MALNLDNLKTFYNAIAERFKSSRGNWKQNDPTADDYIKNRPFWEENEKEVTIAPKQNIGLYPEARIDGDYIYPEEGEIYIIYFNGVRYELPCWRSASLGNVIGNSFYINGIDNGSNAPFLLYSGRFLIVENFKPFTVSMSLLINGEEVEIFNQDVHLAPWFSCESYLMPFELIDGHIYEVKWDNDIYNFTAAYNEEWRSIILGDITQNSFMITDNCNAYSIDNNIHTISITNVTTGVIIVPEMYVCPFVDGENYRIRSLQKGKKYTVIFDNKKYKCEAKIDPYGNVYIGNTVYASACGWDGVEIKNTNEPFFMCSYEPENWNMVITSSNKIHTFSIDGTETVIHKLDKKFIEIPDGAVKKDDLKNVAYSGDYLDLNNRPYLPEKIVAYEKQWFSDSDKEQARQNIDAVAVDETYVKNDYFGSFKETKTYTWNGSTAGRSNFYFVNGSSTEYFYKISDDTFNLNDIVSYTNKSTTTPDDTRTDITIGSNCYKLLYGIIVLDVNDCSINGNTFTPPETGIYFRKLSTGWYQTKLSLEISNPIQVGQAMVVKSLDENGKPAKWEAVNITNSINSINDESATTITSPNGTRYKIIVSDDGTLSATAIT